MRINVTDKHIKYGRPKSDCYCPIAIAINEAMRSISDDPRASVGPFFTSVYQADKLVNNRFSAENPAEVTEFIKKYDLGHKVEPFSFELNLVLL